MDLIQFMFIFYHIERFLLGILAQIKDNAVRASKKLSKEEWVMQTEVLNIVAARHE